MALNFLCPVHRDWVYFHPQEALSYIENSQQQGETLLQQQNWHEAIAHLGCAFEATEILMELQGAAKSFLLSRLTSLAALLANSFKQLNEHHCAQLILQQARDKLQQAADASLGNKPRLTYIQECLFTIRTIQEQFKVKHMFEQPILTEQIH
tara:strand:+ start:13897 stop:14352 length:456 start_codon:yes stop_codon:yes gene_type:complete